MNTALELFSSLPPQMPLHRFSVEQYHRMGELGVLTADEKVELLEGWIVEKMNQRPIHGYTVRRLCEILQHDLPAGFLIQCRLPITTERSEPEPDIAIIRGRQQDFRERHPFGTDCRLVVEVADTSLQRDRAKAAIYSSAGVEEYWIVNVYDQCLERFQLCRETMVYQEARFATDQEISIQIGDAMVAVNLQKLFS